MLMLIAYYSFCTILLLILTSFPFSVASIMVAGWSCLGLGRNLSSLALLVILNDWKYFLSKSVKVILIQQWGKTYINDIVEQKIIVCNNHFQ